MTLGIVYYGRLYRVRVCGRVRGGDHETDKKKKIVLYRSESKFTKGRLRFREAGTHHPPNPNPTP
jgi:hypothetical protein